MEENDDFLHSFEEGEIQANPIIPAKLLNKVKSKFKLRKVNDQVTDRALYDKDVSTSSIAHIFLGGISKAGYTKDQPVGMHVITHGSDLDAVEPDQSPNEKSEKTRAVRPVSPNDEGYAPPGRNGVYKAKVWLRETRWNKWKEKESTMFPADWDAEKVIDVINRSYDVAKKIDTSNGTETWEGRDPITGAMIVMKCIPNTGEIVTSYPKYERT
ncbi:EndoU domain-containing protein [Bacillus cereus group sp. N12]|uniref:EndoU domain-containing protein n=1 Tax=Bacillus cereus group sp. N12 TaxID=2794586 RepID=UPI0018F50344|nr:EndoU domain-containing protein [Bacillus cereus group sp. N12]MBJ8077275.1 EndoU domain-containing protein [Bacillus cereus group sp. N12]